MPEKKQYCFECNFFPCARLKHLDKRYQSKYGMSEIANLENIKKNGIRKFIKSEEKKYIKDNKIFCVHDKRYYEIKK